MSYADAVRPSTQTRLAIVCAAMAFALLCRYVYAFHLGLTHINTDTGDYFSMAKAIMSGEPYSYLPNGYPILIAGFLSLFGEAGAGQGLLWLNVILGAATVALATDMASRSGVIAALLCAMILSIWPNQLNYTRLLMSETPATIFLVFGVFLAQNQRSLSAGVTLGLAALFRSTLLPVGLIVAAVMFLFDKRMHAGWLLAGVIAVLIAETAAVGAGILAKSSNFGPNLIISITGTSSGGVDFHTNADTRTPFMSYFGFMISHPVTFFEQRWSSFWELWGPWPNAGDEHAPRSALARAVIGLRFPLLILSIAGVFARFITRDRDPNGYYDALVLLAPIAAVTALHVVFFSTARFSFPVEPFAIILASGLAGDAIRRATPPAAHRNRARPVA